MNYVILLISQYNVEKELVKACFKDKLPAKHNSDASDLSHQEPAFIALKLGEVMFQQKTPQLSKSFSSIPMKSEMEQSIIDLQNNLASDPPNFSKYIKDFEFYYFGTKPNLSEDMIKRLFFVLTKYI
jgi:hypothetical protein